jgi:hypothetical protein
MVNLTIMVEEDILTKAQMRAQEQNITINALISQYLEKYSGYRKKSHKTSAPIPKYPTSQEAWDWMPKKLEVNKKTAQKTMLNGVPGVELLKFAGLIEPNELLLMSEAIEADCRQVDLNEW